MKCDLPFKSCNRAHVCPIHWIHLIPYFAKIVSSIFPANVWRNFPYIFTVYFGRFLALVSNWNVWREDTNSEMGFFRSIYHIILFWIYKLSLQLTNEVIMGKTQAVFSFGLCNFFVLWLVSAYSATQNSNKKWYKS